MGARRIPVRVVRHPRARRYLLRVQPDGVVRLTVPPRGSLRAAWEFATRQAGWITRQLHRQSVALPATPCWDPGTEILYRGALTALRVVPGTTGARVVFADQQLAAPGPTDLRPAVEQHLWSVARRELPVRTRELAATHGLVIQRVSVRNQRTRWGSCSRRGTISLNWRLIQMPPAVRDYVILHELMHRREMNHSPRFWREVERVCPGYRDARRWLRAHRHQLR